ncbi:MAG: hypothetical protein Q9187_005300, partial [Circinaria calcarea]
MSTINTPETHGTKRAADEELPMRGAKRVDIEFSAPGATALADPSVDTIMVSINEDPITPNAMASAHQDLIVSDTVMSDADQEASSSTIVAPTTSVCRPLTLTTIPMEIRLQIYAKLLPSGKLYYLHPLAKHPRKRNAAGEPIQLPHIRPEALTTLSLVCKTFRDEVPRAFLAQNAFSFNYKSAKGLMLLQAYDQFGYLKSVRATVNFSAGNATEATGAMAAYVRLLAQGLGKMQALEEVCFRVHGGIVPGGNAQLDAIVNAMKGLK